jgi:uncharacterized protein (TIGR02453 family)
MFQPATIRFVKDLKKNNNKPWFEKNKAVYLDAKADFESFVQQLILATGKMDTDIATLQVKDCVFRIYRDVRFSKNKEPYKPNMGASLNLGGKKIQAAGYYFHFEPGQSFAAGGIYMPQAPDLAKLRQEIDYNYADWKKIIGKADFKKQFPNGVDGIENLSRPPKGYEADNPAIAFLKMKSYIVSHPVPDSALGSKALLKEVLQAFKAMQPMIRFLNRAISE